MKELTLEANELAEALKEVMNKLDLPQVIVIFKHKNSLQGVVLGNQNSPTDAAQACALYDEIERLVVNNPEVRERVLAAGRNTN